MENRDANGLTVNDIVTMTGISRATIYREMKAKQK